MRHRRRGRQRGENRSSGPVRGLVLLHLRQYLPALPVRVSSSCEQREFMSGAQAPLARVPLADGTLVATAEVPPDDLIPSLLATSDVLGTGWYAAAAAQVQSGSTVVVVGDGAVGLMGVLAAKQMEAGRIIAMSRHKARQELALEYGATHIISERGDEGVARIKQLTNGVGADAVLECVGTKESMTQAIQCARPGP